MSANFLQTSVDVFRTYLDFALSVYYTASLSSITFSLTYLKICILPFINNLITKTFNNWFRSLKYFSVLLAENVEAPVDFSLVVTDVEDSSYSSRCHHSSSVVASIPRPTFVAAKSVEEFADGQAELSLRESVDQRIENEGRLGEKCWYGCSQGRQPHPSVSIQRAELADETDDGVRCPGRYIK